jgi:hypothetical protein
VSNAERYRLPAEYATDVFRAEGEMIGIRQEDGVGNDTGTILVSPERVERLIQMLQAVKDEIMTERADAAEARFGKVLPLRNS